MLQIDRWKVILITLVSLWGVVFSLPNFMAPSVQEKLAEWDLPMLPSQAINLGLDLQGGSYLMLQVGLESVVQERINDIAATTRAELRKKSLRVAGLRKTAEGVQISLRSDQSVDDILDALSSDMDLSDYDIDTDDEAKRIMMALSDDARDEVVRLTMQQSIEIIRQRVDETGTREPVIQTQGEDRIVVQLPGVDNPERIKDLLGRTAKMTFHLVDSTVSCAGVDSVPASLRCLPMAENPMTRLPLVRRPILTGETLVDSQPSFDQFGEPVVSFRFNRLGARKFGEVTTDHTGEPFAIVLDGEIITAPRINEPILGGSGQISGSFTPDEANDLAILLRAGALPAPLTVVEERSVGPSLGQDSVNAGQMAGLVSIILVVVFMAIIYQVMGALAAVALGINFLMILALLSVLQATLTLPGIAGIVLTVGMAVDANVLIFERIREERRNGFGAIMSIDKGYQGAMSTIMDANITTLISAALLYMLGTGPVRGFAVTLSIGVLTSLFSSIYLTRMLIVVWLRRDQKRAEKLIGVSAA